MPSADRDGRAFSTAPVSTRPLVLALALAGALLLAAGTLGHLLVAVGFIDERWTERVRNATRYIGANTEGNVWTWYSTVLLAAVGAAFLLHALLRRRAGAAHRPFLLLAGVALYLSVDEAARLHERLQGLVPDGILLYQWLLLGIPIAVLVGLVVLRASRHIGRLLRRRLVLAGGVYLAGAAGVELITSLILSAAGFDEDPDSFLFAIGFGIEEGLEVAGVLIALWAVLSALRVQAGPGGVLVQSDAVEAAPAAGERERSAPAI